MQRSASEAQAASGALAHVGQPPIASLDQPTNAARIAKARFADVRDGLLREKDWNFASAWVIPARDPADAVGFFRKRYPLPEDCLAVRSIQDLGADAWAVEGSAVNTGEDAAQVMTLVTNCDAPRVNYTRRIENPALWDALFLDVFQLRLGAAIAPLLARNTSLAENLEARAMARLGVASRKDAKERAQSQVPRDTSWLRSRGVHRSIFERGTVTLPPDPNT